MGYTFNIPLAVVPTVIAPQDSGPRMGQRELDKALLDLADRFQNAPIVGVPQMNAQLGKVPPASQKLLELALQDKPVWWAIAGGDKRDGAFGGNAWMPTGSDFAALKAEVARGGPELDALRQAVEVDPTK